MWYQNAMTITLLPDQTAWLEKQIGTGGFQSLEEVARQLIDERIAEIAALETDDLTWAKPLVDAAEAEVSQGKFVSLEEHEARVAAFLAAMP